MKKIKFLSMILVIVLFTQSSLPAIAEVQDVVKGVDLNGKDFLTPQETKAFSQPSTSLSTDISETKVSEENKYHNEEVNNKEKVDEVGTTTASKSIEKSKEAVEKKVPSPKALINEKWGTSPWSFNSTTGELIIGAGTLSEVNASPWNRSDNYKIDQQAIKKITLTGKVIAPENSRGLFSSNISYTGLEHVTEFVGLKNLDTSRVTNFAYMFYKMTSVTSLDLSNFDTSQATDMRAIFKFASSLTDLDLPSFNTSQVLNMADMFLGASSLIELDLSNFNTSKVQDMTSMFYGASSLTSLYLFSFDTSSVTKATNMFGNTSLSKLALGDKFKFKGTESLGIPTYSGLKGSATGNWIRTAGNSKGYTPTDFMANYGTGDLTAGIYEAERQLWGTSPWAFDATTGELTIDAGSLEEGTSSPMSTGKVNSKAIKKINFVGKVYAPKNSNTLFWNGDSYLTNLTEFVGISNFDTSQVTTMRNLFAGLTSLKSLDLSHFDTSKVTDMSRMFDGDYQLISLNLSNFNTSQVKYTDAMFKGLTSLRDLDLTSFDTSLVTTTIDMFKDVSLDTLTLGAKFKFKGTESLGVPTYSGPKGSATGNWARIDGTSKGYTPTDFMANYGTGDLTAGTYGAERQLWGTSPWTFDATTGELTIGAGSLDVGAASPMSTGKVDPKAIKKINFVGKVYAPKDSGALFWGVSNGYLTNLTEFVGMSNFDTSNATNMHQMFENLSSLKTLDVSGFNTNKVIDMGYMFDNNSQLTSLNVSGLDTSNVTNMSYMFRNIPKLKSIDVSSFKTTQVQNMASMFQGNASLETLDVSNFDTSQVTNMASMFYGLSKVKALNLSNFNTSKVTDMYHMFMNNPTLEALDLSNFDMSKVTSSVDMFKGTSLVNLSLGNDFKFNGTEALDVPSYSGLKGSATGNWMRIDGQSKGYTPTDFMTNYGTGDLTAGTYGAERQLWGTSPWAFDATTGELTIGAGTLDVNSYSPMATGKVDPKAIKKINFVGKVYAPKDSVALFWGVSNGYLTNLTEIVGMSNFDTSRVTNMSQFFVGLNSLKTLDLTHFDTSNVTNMYGMFENLSSLEALDVSHFDTSNVTNMNRAFRGLTRLTTLDVSGFNTNKVIDMAYMFDNNPQLTNLNVSGLDTSNVTTMNCMFRYAHKLKSIDVSSFKTTQVQNMTAMFQENASLETLDVSNFDTSQVTNMDWMFYGLSKVKALNLSNFNTSKVTDMYNMFMNSSELKTLDLSNFDMDQITRSTDMFKGTSLTSLSLGIDFKFNGTESLGAPNYTGTVGVSTGKWIREDGQSKSYSPMDFMTNYGMGDLTTGTYITELEHASLSLDMKFNKPSGSITVGNTISTTITIINDSRSSSSAKEVKLKLGTFYSEKIEGALLFSKNASLIERDEEGNQLSSSMISLTSEITLNNLQQGHTYEIVLSCVTINNTRLDSENNYQLSVDYLSGKDLKTTEVKGVYHIVSGNLSFYNVPDNLEFPKTTLSGNKMVKRELSDWSLSISDMRGTNPETSQNTSSPRTNWDIMATVTDFKDSSGNIIPPSTLTLAYVDSRQNIQGLSSDTEVLINHHDVTGETPQNAGRTTINWLEEQGFQVKINNYQLLKKDTNYHAQLNLDLRQAP